MNNLVACLALIALTLKLFVLWRAFKYRENSMVFFCLTLVFCMMNLISLLIVLNVTEVEFIGWILGLQYVCATWASVLLCWYAIKAVYSKSNLKLLLNSLCSIGLIISAAILFTNGVVDGAVSIGYSLTAVKGPFFAIFLVFMAICFSVTIATLANGVIKSNDYESANRCLWALLSISPLIVAGLIISALLHLGVKINGSGLIPLATSIFLLITLKTERLHQLTDVRRHLPFSAENSASREFSILFTQYSFNKISYKEFKSQSAILALKYKYDKSDSVTDLAREIGLNRSTVSNLLSKHGIRR